MDRVTVLWYCSSSLAGEELLFTFFIMLILIQYPFSDIRKFIDTPKTLTKPGWPLPTPDSEFVRHFGIIRRRRNGGIDGWIGENEICRAEKVLRFNGDLSFVDSKINLQMTLRCVFRYLYFDGWAVGKFEIGISPKKQTNVHLPKKITKKLINHILQLPVRIRKPLGDSDCCQLIHAGKYLARMYLESTTPQNSLNKLDPWWVQSGSPMLLLQYNRHETVELPYRCQVIELKENSGISLSHVLIPYDGVEYNACLLGPKSLHAAYTDEYSKNKKSLDDREMHTLRMSLSRLHAEHECLRSVLRHIKDKRLIPTPKTDESNNLQTYLNKATKRIRRIEQQHEQKFSEEIIDIARKSLSIIYPGQYDILLDAIAQLDMRSNIKQKLIEYARYNFYGPVGMVIKDSDVHQPTINQNQSDLSTIPCTDLTSTSNAEMSDHRDGQQIDIKSIIGKLKQWIFDIIKKIFPNMEH